MNTPAKSAPIGDDIGSMAAALARTKKSFALTVARMTVSTERTFLLVQIPWDQFGTAGGPEAYARLIEEMGALAVIVAKSPQGEWASSTKHRDDWEAASRLKSLDSAVWHTMAIESTEYPWESFGRLK